MLYLHFQVDLISVCKHIIYAFIPEYLNLVLQLYKFVKHISNTVLLFDQLLIWIIISKLVYPIPCAVYTHLNLII